MKFNKKKYIRQFLSKKKEKKYEKKFIQFNLIVFLSKKFFTEQKFKTKVTKETKEISTIFFLLGCVKGRIFFFFAEKEEKDWKFQQKRGRKKGRREKFKIEYK